ncbi:MULTISPECIES: hypothetical protein [unclassified Bradyrhizobium]|uniref:hypothetical protein n=1 Tax=unclassified Bradyrhizobium TaxID=2631580 RepID=UPI0028EB9089|nr:MULTISPECIES: hypothetical protein [unclassified Bradyrhizobium]
MTADRDDALDRPSEPGSHRWPRRSLNVVPLASFAGAFLGCLATLHLCTSGLSPALASVTATLLLCAGLITARTRDLLPTTFSSSVYGGSFSGMTPIVALSESVARSGLPVDRSFLLLSLFCGLVFCSVCAIEMRLRVVLLRGYGGRFGALAAIGSFLFLSLAPLLGADGAPVRVASLQGFDRGLNHSVLMLALCGVGMVATMAALRLPRVAAAGRPARIFVSAALACAGLVILQQLAPDDARLSDAYFAGCFVGMSSPQRLRGVVQPLVAAVALTALLVQAAAVLPSVGGSLGFAAFVAVVGVDAGRRIISRAALPPERPARISLGRSLAAALAIAGVLLPNDLFQSGPVEETTGSIVQAERPPQPEPAVPAEPVAAEPAVAAVPIELPADASPAAETTSDVVRPVARPAPSEPPRRRRASRPAVVAPQSRPIDPEPWRIIRDGQQAGAGTAATGSPPARAKRSQARVPGSVPAPPRAAPRPRTPRVEDPQPSVSEPR